MANQDNRSKSADDLRQTAKALARGQAFRTPEDSSAFSPEEIRQTLHELQEYLINLEMQNKELRTAQTRIEAERARYFDLYNLAPVGYCTLSEQGLILEANFTAATLLCMARGVLISQPISRFILKDDQDIYYLQRKKFFETGEPQECELRLVKPDGAIFWAHLRATAAQAEDGAPICRVVLSDITERKRSEEELKRRELMLNKIFDVLPIGLWFADKNGKLIMGNPAGVKIWGAEPTVPMEEYGVFKARRLPSGEEIAPNDWALAHTIKNGTTITDELLEIDAFDGRKKIILNYTAPVMDDAGRMLGAIVVNNDISEYKRAEKSIAEQHSLIEAIYSKAPLIMLVVDGNHRLRQVNGFATQFTGWQAEEMLGLRSGAALRCLHALDDPEGCGLGEFCNNCVIRNKVLETLEHGVANLQFEASFDFSSEDGTQSMTLLVSTTPITFQDENMALVIIMDITKRNQAEKEKEGLLVQLSQAQKMESIGRLAGGVAHDFNNMLSIINGYAEMSIEMLDPADPLYENISEICNAGKRSANIVRQLLAFARQQTINPVQLDLNDTIASMLKMLQRLIGENINLAWLPGKNLWMVKIDPSQVDQIMANLVVNSRDAISDVGKLTIETKNTIIDEGYCKSNPEAIPGRYVMLAVSDDGCGMYKEIQERLFDPYFTTKEIGKGTGLGLPTIYGIVKQNNGFINVYSEPGEGTTFKLYFPCYETEKSSVPAAKESSGKMPIGAEIILIVEDEKAILQLSKRMLERLGYTVQISSNPLEALNLSEEYDGTIDLLITDVVMPEMNGKDLSSRLTQIHPGLKTLYMSGYTADVIAHHGVLDEGVQFIQKPFSLKDLAVKVREIIDQE